MTEPVGPTLGGALTDDGHALWVRIYHEDTDFSGAVFHGSYVRFLERGRSDFLRGIGVSHRALEAEGLHFAVSEMNLSFLGAAGIDDVVEVKSTVAELRGARVVLAQSIDSAAGRLVKARVTIVLIDQFGRPRRFPAAVKAALAAQKTDNG